MFSLFFLQFLFHTPLLLHYQPSKSRKEDRVLRKFIGFGEFKSKDQFIHLSVINHIYLLSKWSQLDSRPPSTFIMGPSACYILPQDNRRWETGRSRSSWTAKCPYCEERYLQGLVLLMSGSCQPAIISLYLSLPRLTLVVQRHPANEPLYLLTLKQGAWKLITAAAAHLGLLVQHAEVLSPAFHQLQQIRIYIPTFLVALLWGRSLTPLFLSLLCAHV